MLWIKYTYNWIKENMLVVGAAIGSIATIILTILLRRGDDSAETILKHNQESNENRKEKDQRDLAIVEKFEEDLSVVREQARQAGEELSEEQEEVLVQRLEEFSSADTDDERRKIAEDIQEVFPFMNMVDPSEFGNVE
tara:strand:+ start:42 stop:455 length:414 start_codon:yes stop_codon:yes gene_type:complete